MKIKFVKSIFTSAFIFLVTLNCHATLIPNNTSSKAEAAANKTSNALSDTALTGKVKAKIAMDPIVSVFDIDVSTSHRVVMLSGTVNSDTDASALVQLAQSTDGVKDVDASKLNVKNSTQPFTDTVITAKVKGAYIREKLLGNNVPASVTVETNNGVVYLSGTVENQQQLNNAVAIAKSISSIKHVKSRLSVKKT